MDRHLRVPLCRWAGPTLFLSYPSWLDAEDRPWCCLRRDPATPLETTETCRDCPDWEAAFPPLSRPRRAPARH